MDALPRSIHVPLSVLFAFAYATHGCASMPRLRVRTPIAGLRAIGPAQCFEVIERLRVAHRRDRTLLATSAPITMFAFATNDVAIFADGPALAEILRNMPSCGTVLIAVHDNGHERYTAYEVPNDTWPSVVHRERRRVSNAEIVAVDEDEHVIVVRENR